MKFTRWRGLDDLSPVTPDPTPVSQLPAESNWFAKPGKTHFQGQQAVYLFGILLLGFGGIGFVADTGGAAETLLGVALLVATVAAIVFCVRTRAFSRYLQASAEDLSLIDSLKAPDCLVEVVIYQHWSQSGQDIGILGVADGALYFAGRGSSFLLGPQDIDLLKPFHEVNEHFVLPRNAITVRHPRRRITLAVHILRRKGRDSEKDDLALREALEQFVASKPYPGKRTYPPFKSPPTDYYPS